MLDLLLAMSCLADIKPYEKDLAKQLPGNASTFKFHSCIAAKQPVGGLLDAEGFWHLEQQTCIRGWCKTVWEYSGTAYARVLLDGRCTVSGVKVWSVPGNRLLEPLVRKAEEKIKEKFADVLAEHPEYRAECED